MRTILLLSTLCLVSLAQGPQPSSGLVGGPYVIETGQRTATVMWVTAGGSASVGTTPEANEKTAPSLHVQKVSFAGLQPGKTYYYDVQQGAAGKGSFKAAPTAGQPFRFIVYGDTRTRYDVHRTVINAILREETPDFVLHTGDMVENGGQTDLWPIFFDIERELLRKTTLFPSFGNHERNDQQFYDLFDMRLPYYSFDWGNAHFAVMDSDLANLRDTAAKETQWTAQMRWHEEDLAGSQKAAYRFVAAHHPPMSAVPERQNANQEMKALMPMFEKYKLTAGLFGHDHNYQHYLKNGVHYIISGGGGAPLYEVDKPPEGITQKVIKIENFVVFSLNGAKIHVEAKGVDGAVLDSFDLNQSPAP